eukprot:CAMPEP_0117519288 /NCGR_PEP_ID=MMETSP0784-20121206/32572_1 /TAXON_ID=39447 /ORGANISM="" /LENGTH=385 /DNA_ID=CAMNT_0005315239 /DNA_START=86 /DNA_END=1244 /DNA_ORIENTATION=-
MAPNRRSKAPRRWPSVQVRAASAAAYQPHAHVVHPRHRPVETGADLSAPRIRAIANRTAADEARGAPDGCAGHEPAAAANRCTDWNGEAEGEDSRNKPTAAPTAPPASNPVAAPPVPRATAPAPAEAADTCTALSDTTSRVLIWATSAACAALSDASPMARLTPARTEVVLDTMPLLAAAYASVTFLLAELAPKMKASQPRAYVSTTLATASASDVSDLRALGVGAIAHATAAYEAGGTAGHGTRDRAATATDRNADGNGHPKRKGSPDQAQRATNGTADDHPCGPDSGAKGDGGPTADAAATCAVLSVSSGVLPLNLFLVAFNAAPKTAVAFATVSFTAASAPANGEALLAWSADLTALACASTSFSSAVTSALAMDEPLSASR